MYFKVVKNVLSVNYYKNIKLIERILYFHFMISGFVHSLMKIYSFHNDLHDMFDTYTKMKVKKGMLRWFGHVEGDRDLRFMT